MVIVQLVVQVTAKAKIKICCSSVYSKDSLEQNLAPEVPNVLLALLVLPGAPSLPEQPGA
jgi:hypothetical protein